MKSVLNRIRKSTASSVALSLLVVCLFLLAKTKTPRVEKAPVPAPEVVQMPPVSQALPIPEIVPPEEAPQKSERVFSRQLNRHRRVIVAVAKRSTKRAFRKVNAAKLAKLNEVAEAGLSESPQGAVFNVDPYESETHLDPQFSLAALFPREVPLNIHEGRLVANDSTVLWETLESFPAAPQLTKVNLNSKSEWVASQPVEQDDTSSDKAEPELAAAAPAPAPATGPASTAQAPVALEKSLQPIQAVPTEVQSLVDQGRKALEIIQKTMTTQPKKNSNRNIVPGVELPSVMSTQPIGRVYGKLTFDNDVQEWLERAQGHVELKLHKMDSSDPQDMFFVDYQYPDVEFSWDGREVLGGYQLTASFFNSKQTGAVAQVLYPNTLNSETAKRRVIFHIQKSDLENGIRSIASRNQGGVVLSGTVFEANPADHKNEKTISAAEIEVVGYPQWGTFQTDAEGTFRIPNVTANSEFVINVKAAGYYPTQAVVPVFQTTGYVSVHLVAKDLVNTITGFFTKRPQSEQKGLIFGRVYDPQTKVPQADQEMFLAGRSSSALYFNILPEPGRRQTTDTGSFAYFNVDPAFRSLGKTGSSVAHLLQVKPGSAYYLESGRGGNHAFRGKLLDPYRKQMVPGLVKIVGASTQVETNDMGEFEISNVDLSPGVITFEVEAEGYPKSWHTLPWSSRDPRSTYIFYLPEKELVEEARVSVAKVTEIPNRGILLGGAESSFFGKNRKCVYVTLARTDGAAVSSEHGPYPLHHRVKNRTASSQCLSKESPGFGFYNLEPGEYLLRWQTSQGESLRSHVARVGSDRVSILIN
ncbi:MAG: hypothetical protein ACKN9V_01865 [Pseudomonadota bacterium]